MRSTSSSTRLVEARTQAASPVLLQLMMTAALIVSIIIAATAVSIGAADAQSIRGATRPDTGLVLMLMLLAIGAMGVLSALAVRVACRSRPQSE